MKLGDRVRLKNEPSRTGKIVDYEELSCPECDETMVYHGEAKNPDGTASGLLFACPTCGKIIQRHDVDFRVSWDQPIDGLRTTEVHPTEIEKIEE